MKIRKASEGRISFFCPACNHPHAIPVEGDNAFRWNGDSDYPSIAQIIEVHGLIPNDHPDLIKALKGEPYPQHDTLCKCSVYLGRISFHPHCTHAFAGATVDLPEYEKRVN
jgi:hypothetical protein